MIENIRRQVEIFYNDIQKGTFKHNNCFWSTYYKLFNKIIFLGIHDSYITGNMEYMLNGIYQENRIHSVFQNTLGSGGDQLINIFRCIPAYACNDYSLIYKIMPQSLGLSTRGPFSAHYNMIYAITYRDEDAGEKAKEGLLNFMSKKHPRFNLVFSKFLYDLYQLDIAGINQGLQEMCNTLGRSNSVNEGIYGASEELCRIGKTVAIFVHAMYHLALKRLSGNSLLEDIVMPKHKGFVSEYEQYNLQNNFPMPGNLIDFDCVAEFINASIETEVIPEVTLHKVDRYYTNDGRAFEKAFFENMRKYGVLDFEMEGEQYVFKKIK